MLRGRPIFFLHYYHHALVLYSVFSTYPNNGSFARLETMMSAVVRCILYTYFALVAVSSSYRKYSKYVTYTHLLQFIIICFGIVYARKRIERGEPCETDTSQLSFHSLLMIFAQFIYAYLTRTRVSRGGLRLRKIK
uniref:Elongation of very long chain fatty acids protein n=1 Tax=Panagrolaimus davidi TaxID=227884 RepID=A0A914QF67_9BILA